MNSFETDMKRAISSKGFITGLAVGIFILMKSGFDSQLYRISLPVLAALPYTTAWLMDYQTGYLKLYITRSSRTAYILGKFSACAISGGLVTMLPGALCLMIQGEEAGGFNLWLLFFSGMMWSVVSAVLAAFSKSRYLAYGGGFVIYYLLVILYERYFPKLYCLYPYEWLSPTHTWVFNWQGIVVLLTGILLILCFLYYEILRQSIERG